MKQLARYSGIILLTLGMILLLWQFRNAVILFLLSLALAAIIRPLTQRFAKLGLPMIMAVLLPYFITIAALAGLVYISWLPLTKELQLASENLAVSYDRLLVQWSQGTLFQQAITEHLPPLTDFPAAITGEQDEEVLSGIFGFTSNFFSVVSSIVIALVLSMYWSADRVHFERFWLSILPVHKRTQAREAWRDIESSVGDYLRSDSIQLLGAVILLAILYRLIGMQYPTLLAILCGFAWLIPWVGAILAMAPPFLIGLGTNLGVAIVGALVTLLVLLALELLVEKHIVNRRSYNSITVILTLLAMVDVFGFVGVFIAPPLSAAIQSVSWRLWIKPRDVAESDPGLEISRLRAKLMEAQEMADKIAEPPPHIFSMIARIGTLLERSEELLLDQ